MNKIFITVIILFSFHTAKAQEQNSPDLCLDYTTEVQSTFGKKFNQVNLLSLEGRHKPWKNGELSLQTISVWKTRKERIIDDLQTFSNIEEDNIAINIFLAGYTHHFKNIDLFWGIRNVNNDYFIGDYTSLFTNSSCGIYPTLSINFTIANYPLSAMCIHGEFELSKRLILKNSLYNGTARELLSKNGSLFTINPKNEGLLNVTELSYLSKTNNYGLCNIGTVLYTGDSVYADNEQKKSEKREKTKINYAVWGSIEKAIYNSGNKSVGILFQSSFAPADRNDCKYYYGAGVILNSIIPTRNKNTMGFFCNRAIFQETTENTLDITWKYDVNGHLVLQPTLHCIKTGSTKRIVGLIRLCYHL